MRGSKLSLVLWLCLVRAVRTITCRTGESSSTAGQCQPCAPGRYQPKKMSILPRVATPCQQCPHGKFQALMRMGGCDACPHGLYPDPQRVKCLSPPMDPATAAARKDDDDDDDNGQIKEKLVSQKIVTPAPTPQFNYATEAAVQQLAAATTASAPFRAEFAAKPAARFGSLAPLHELPATTTPAVAQIAEEVENLAQLRAEGVLSAQEFDQAKDRVLGVPRQRSVRAPASRSTQGTAANIVAKKVCVAGKYQIDYKSGDYCLACPSGKFTDNAGEHSCRLCQAGRYQPSPNRASCLPCRAGQQKTEAGQVRCVTAPSAAKQAAPKLSNKCSRNRYGPWSKCSSACGPGTKYRYHTKVSCTALSDYKPYSVTFREKRSCSGEMKPSCQGGSTSVQIPTYGQGGA